MSWPAAAMSFDCTEAFGCCGASIASASAKTVERRFPKFLRAANAAECCAPAWFGSANRCPRKFGSEAETAAREADLFLLIGTSAVVYPAAGLAPIAKSAGARVVEINIAESGLAAGQSGGIDEFLQGPSGELLPQLIA